MDAYFINIISSSSAPVLIGIIGLLIYVLGKGADLLMDEAVVMSTRLGISNERKNYVLDIGYDIGCVGLFFL